MGDHADDMQMRTYMDALKDEFEFFGGRNSREYKQRKEAETKAATELTKKD